MPGSPEPPPQDRSYEQGVLRQEARHPILRQQHLRDQQRIDVRHMVGGQHHSPGPREALDTSPVRPTQRHQDRLASHHANPRRSPRRSRNFVNGRTTPTVDITEAFVLLEDKSHLMSHVADIPNEETS